MTDPNERRQKMKDDLASLFGGAKAELKHFVDKAEGHIDRVVDGARELHEDFHADPEVKRFKRRFKSGLASLGKKLVHKHGTKAESEALHRANRKKKVKESQTPPSEPPASPQTPPESGS